MITRILVSKEKYFYQRDYKPVDTQYGRVAAEAINDTKDGLEVQSNTHEKFTLLTPTFLDRYRRMERGPQLMMLKDLGYIAAETGMGHESIVGDAGTGTGAAAIYFSRIAKHVHSYDIEDKHLEIGKRNVATLEVTNVAFAKHDIYESIPDLQFDVFVLDNPEPWRALPHYTSIKLGGWIVAYTPTIVQAAQFVDALPKEVQYRKTTELIERFWHSAGQKIRPSSDSVGHTGFLVFVRRVQ